MRATTYASGGGLQRANPHALLITVKMVGVAQAEVENECSDELTRAVCALHREICFHGTCTRRTHGSRTHTRTQTHVELVDGMACGWGRMGMAATSAEHFADTL